MNRFLSLLLLLGILSCGNSNGSQKSKQQDSEVAPDSVEVVVKDTVIAVEVVKEPPVKQRPSSVQFGYDKDGLPVKNVYAKAGNRANCFFVISKVHPEHLSVYEVKEGRDTALLATYPVCVARNKGQKERKGDNKTPESYPGKPFSISRIQDAHDWHHDFGDGRGSIPAYGHWFMRLETPGFSGIGIHGSTNNRGSIKTGRGSEGCIRLLDEDIIHLKENYAQVGTRVIILPEDHGPLPFEVAALKKVPAREVKVEQPEVKPVEKPVTSPSVNKASAFVIVKGNRVNLRTGPDPVNDPLYLEGEVAICPEDGDRLEYLGETDRYYKVKFQGKELYINKQNATLE